MKSMPATIMNSKVSRRARGFSMVELMVAMTVGLVIMGGAMELFKSGMSATMMVTEQAEMQQNVRAALNLVTRDINMAGSGLPSGGLALPYGVGATPSFYACNQKPTCYLTSDKYPTGVVGTTAVSNYMYGLIPGSLNGMEAGGPATIAATKLGADSVTVAYKDYSFPLNQYTIALDPKFKFVTATAPAVPPAGFPGIVSANGIVPGDLLMLSNNNGTAVVEVTSVVAAGLGGTINFANGDPLNINQSGAASGNVQAALSAGGTIQANRIFVVSYWLEVPALAGQTPRLMRQVNGQTPVPVADNVIGLNFTYDMCDSVTVTKTCAGVANPIASGFSPNEIHKVNIQMMGQSVLATGGQSRSMALVTSVSTRNLSYVNRY